MGKVCKRAEVIAPAGNLRSLKAAVSSGADAVYLGFRDATNARNFE
ncbi:MAG: U32 family peptidase, partial [Thermodesulfobacteriota bacterium]